MPWNEVVALAFIAFGLFFSITGIVGIVRLPDVYTRIHASGKVAVLGLIGLLAGSAFLMPETTTKAVVLILFMLLTSPVASHAIAQSAYRQKVARAGVVRDDLPPVE